MVFAIGAKASIDIEKPREMIFYGWAEPTKVER
jgi:hypothetical protein